MNNQLKPCPQPQAHPARCGCEQSGTEQVSSAWLAQLRSEYRQAGEACKVPRESMQMDALTIKAKDARIAELEQDSKTLSQCFDLFSIGSLVRTPSTLLTCIQNTKRFAEYLHAVEREFFMVPGEPSDEPEDEGCEPEDECIVNCWGSSRDQYIEQFRAALARIAQQPGVAPLDDQPYSDPRNGDETFSANGEDWHDYDLPDLLNDRPDLKAGDTVFRAIKHYQDPASFVDHEALISSMNENAGCSDTGEWVDSWPEPGEEAETELTGLLEAWARRHCVPDFHLVRDVTEYTLTAEDLRDHAEGSDHE